MTQLTIQHSPTRYALGEIFRGRATDPLTGLEHDLMAVMVAIEDDGHKGELLLLPAGGRFARNRSFISAWHPVDTVGDWEIQKYERNSAKLAWVTLVPDFQSVRAIALDERQYGDRHKVRVFKHGALTPDEERGLEELGVERTESSTP